MIVKDMHEAIGHKGERKTFKKIGEQYANIPLLLINQFISQCERCVEKKKQNKYNWNSCKTNFNK